MSTIADVLSTIRTSWQALDIDTASPEGERDYARREGVISVLSMILAAVETDTLDIAFSDYIPDTEEDWTETDEDDEV